MELEDTNKESLSYLARGPSAVLEHWSPNLLVRGRNMWWQTWCLAGDDNARKVNRAATERHC
jgi:hypothetical protein